MNPENKKNYNTHYIHEDKQWRRICSKDKAEKIASLCSGHNINKIIEIGAGDGSILESLNKLGFASKYFALEISDSGIKQIKKKKYPSLKK